MSELALTDRIPLDAYAGLLGEAEIKELRALARPLEGSRQTLNCDL